MPNPRGGQDSKSHSNSPPESGPERHAHDSIKFRPLQPVPTPQSGGQLPRLRTLELPTHVTPKNLLQGQLEGVAQDSKSRINSPREPDLDHHHRDRIDLTFMKPAGKHQPDRQLPSIAELKLLSDATPTILRQLQGATSSGPPRGQLKRNRHEAPRQEASEYPYQPAHENRTPAPRYPSIIAAPPKHNCASYEVPYGPPGITPNGHREMPRGQSEQNPQVPPQEARKQQYQSSYESVQATKRHRSECAAPPTNESAYSGVRFGPTGITPNSHRDISRGQSERYGHEVLKQEVQERQDRPPYGSVQAIERHPSGYPAPPNHNNAAYNVPFGPAGMDTNSHREISRGPSERSSQKVGQQEVQARQDRPPYENVPAIGQYRSEYAAPPTQERIGDDLSFSPTGVVPDVYKNISEADKHILFEISSQQRRVNYESLVKAVDYRHSAREIQGFILMIRQRKAREKKREARNK